MGKAARLNRERREKAMREDPDWNNIGAIIAIKKRTWLQLCNAFTLAVGLKEVPTKGVIDFFFHVARGAATNHHGEASLKECGTLKTFVYIVNDDDPGITGDLIDGYRTTSFRGETWRSDISIPSNKWISHDSFSEEDEFMFRDMTYNPSCPDLSIPSFYFMNEILHCEWTIRDLLVESKIQYGHGMLFEDEQAKRLFYIPMAKDDLIGLNAPFDDFESRYYLFTLTDLYVCQSDEHGLLNYYKEMLDITADMILEKVSNGVKGFYALSDIVTVVQGQEFDDYRKSILRHLREFIWHHVERMS
jgi:hypothetical protein